MTIEWSREVYEIHNQQRLDAIEPINDEGLTVVPGTLEPKPRARILYERSPLKILETTKEALTEAEFPPIVIEMLEHEINTYNKTNKYLSLVKACIDYVEPC